MATPLFQVVPQQHNSDCTVACLSMLLGVGYEKVLKAFDHNVAARGAETGQIRKAAQKLKHPLRLRRRVDIGEMDGILALRSKRWKVDHVVMLKDELIIDPHDTTVWDADIYLSHWKAKILYLLTEDE